NEDNRVNHRYAAEPTHQWRGVPPISAQKNKCFQNGLKGKRQKRLLFWAFAHVGVVSFAVKIPASQRRRRAAAAASNTQVNSKYYGGRVSTRAERFAHNRARVARSLAIAGVAGGRRRAIFKSPLGHRRFSVKGSYSSSSKMRTGESCLVVVRFTFEVV